MLLATNYAAIIRPLQVLVLLVAVLFFARVLRASQVAATPTDGSGRRHNNEFLSLEFIEPEDRAGQRVEIERAVVIGRSAECDLKLNDNYLSSRHARVVNDGGELTIEDLGSTNGTYVNQQPVSGRMHLERGDIVQIGGVLFEVVR